MSIEKTFFVRRRKVPMLISPKLPKNKAPNGLKAVGCSYLMARAELIRRFGPAPENDNTSTVIRSLDRAKCGKNIFPGGTFSLFSFQFLLRLVSLPFFSFGAIHSL